MFNKPANAPFFSTGMSDLSDHISERSFHVSRPFSAPGSPSASGRSTPLRGSSCGTGGGGGGSLRSCSDSEDDEDVDDNTERIELGLCGLDISVADEPSTADAYAPA
ncbi:unnamed protein product [Protopolystoma xenopodis]|uniref:Uncharacterized protein n=1 Tax=Protopolystoma xenopodis TaxID=117903 RepID=A0A3S5BQX3_9PLAT|nr:unnamed protein product [Protopolystoma xenopodis]